MHLKSKMAVTCRPPTAGDFLYVIIDTYDGILSNIQNFKIFIIQNYMGFDDYYIF